MTEALSREMTQIRRLILRTVHFAGAGHPGGSLSACDVVTALYFHIMRIDPQRPDWPDRDRFILSKGHASALLYAALAKRGYFPVEELKTFRRIDGRLQGHPDMRKTHGVDMTTGSLGMGLSVGCGMALAGKLSGRNYRVFVMVGDGEMDEGQVWEAMLFGSKYRLDNLTVIVDRNRLQLDGDTEDVMPLEPLRNKLDDFGWSVHETDGHDMTAILRTFESAMTAEGKPSAIIAHTVKGKGVSFMENDPAWHGRAPGDDELAAALHELGGDGDDW